MLRVSFNEKEKLWNSCGAPLVYNPNISLGHILLRSLELYKSQIAQISYDTGEQFTFEQIRLMTIRAAQNLQKRNDFKPKQVIGIMARNVLHLTPIALAAICLGCPINSVPTTSKRNMIRILQLTEPCLVFCETEVYDLVVECLKELKIDAKIFTFNGTCDDSEPVENLFCETGIEEDFMPVDVDGVNEAAIILSTSGTTGLSKGVCLSHAALFSEIDNTNIKMYKNGTVLNASSLTHITALLTLLLSTLGGTTRVTTTQKLSVETQIRIAEEYKLTILENDSYDLLLMLKSGLLPKTDLSSIRYMIIGGCKIPFSVIHEVNSYLPNGSVINEYGLTEVGAVSMDFPRFSGKDTVGRLVNGVSVKIIDDKGDRCGLNENGEICVKPRFKFLGYYKNKELTDEAFDREGFFLTGDIGHIDENGYLYIVDRKKHIIVGNSGWVFPSDIEEILLKSPNIKSVCVVGVPFDEIAEVPAAVVVRTNGSNISEGEISKMVNDNLPDDCKLLGGVYFVDSIPFSPTSKPIRREIKDMATNFYRTNCGRGQ